MIRSAALVAGFCFASASALAESGMQHDDPLFYFVQSERLEYREATSETLWDLQGWYGSDLRKLWIKTEGRVDDGNVRDAQLQILYSRAWTAFFDLQLGVRLSDIDDSEIVSAVAGLQGVAPYRVAVDAALFVSEGGDVSIRSEFERDVFLSEQLILQPRTEISIAWQDVPELGIGSGVSELSVGLRLRYEFTRKFAPYVGLEYEKNFGDTADFIRANGGDPDETSFVAGLRFWF